MQGRKGEEDLEKECKIESTRAYLPVVCNRFILKSFPYKVKGIESKHRCRRAILLLGVQTQYS